MLRVRVYEIQWGDVEMDYVRYFENEEQLKEFQKETGWRVEVLEEVNFEKEEKKVSKVVNFSEKLKQRQEEQEKDKQLEFFRELMLELTYEEREQVKKAILTKDEELYRKITEPAILRRAMREFNQ